MRLCVCVYACVCVCVCVCCVCVCVAEQERAREEQERAGSDRARQLARKEVIQKVEKGEELFRQLRAHVRAKLSKVEVGPQFPLHGALSRLSGGGTRGGEGETSELNSTSSGQEDASALNNISAGMGPGEGGGGLGGGKGGGHRASAEELKTMLRDIEITRQTDETDWGEVRHDYYDMIYYKI